MDALETFESLQGAELYEFVIGMKEMYGSIRRIEEATGIGRSRISRVLNSKGSEVATTKEQATARLPQGKAESPTTKPKKATGDKLTDTDIKALKELITLIEPINEVIQAYNNGISPIIQEYNQSITIDKSRFTGDIVPRQIKTYKNVNNDWIEFCKKNDNYKMQDLYSMALIEFMEKYK